MRFSLLRSSNIRCLVAGLAGNNPYDCGAQVGGLIPATLFLALKVVFCCRRWCSSTVANWGACPSASLQPVRFSSVSLLGCLTLLFYYLRLFNRFSCRHNLFYRCLLITFSCKSSHYFFLFTVFILLFSFFRNFHFFRVFFLLWWWLRKMAVK